MNDLAKSRLYEDAARHRMFAAVPRALEMAGVTRSYGISPALGRDDDLAATLLADAFVARGHAISWLGRTAFVARREGVVLPFLGLRSLFLPRLVTLFTESRFLARDMLREAGIAVPESRVFQAGDRAAGLDWARERFPLVAVKPVPARRGRDVALNVADEAQLAAAWEAAAGPGPGAVMLERQMPAGAELRVMVVRGHAVAAIAKVPQVLAGDGRSSLAGLVVAENLRRRGHPLLQGGQIALDTGAEGWAGRHGLGSDTILPHGARLVLEAADGFAEVPMQLAELVDTSWLDLAERAVAALPGLELAEVQILVEDPGRPAAPGNHVVVDLCAAPDITPYHFPVYGAPCAVAEAVAEAMETLAGAPPAPAALVPLAEAMAERAALLQHLPGVDAVPGTPAASGDADAAAEPVVQVSEVQADDAVGQAEAEAAPETEPSPPAAEPAAEPAVAKQAQQPGVGRGLLSGRLGLGLFRRASPPLEAPAPAPAPAPHRDPWLDRLPAAPPAAAEAGVDDDPREALYREGRVRIVARGLLNGVGFRGWVRDTAAGLGLSGWVRGHPEERMVAILAAGTPTQLRALVGQITHGPFEEAVEMVEVEPTRIVVAEGFHIQHSERNGRDRR